jgi:hypothetical protein
MEQSLKPVQAFYWVKKEENKKKLQRRRGRFANFATQNSDDTEYSYYCSFPGVKVAGT